MWCLRQCQFENLSDHYYPIQILQPGETRRKASLECMARTLIRNLGIFSPQSTRRTRREEKELGSYCPTTASFASFVVENSYKITPPAIPDHDCYRELAEGKFTTETSEHAELGVTDATRKYLAYHTETKLELPGNE